MLWKCRLLVQLEETERVFDNFWRSHEDKLRQCLELRRFEHEFRELQVNLDDNLKLLNEMNEMGDSVARVDILLKETEDFLADCEVSYSNVLDFTIAYTTQKYLQCKLRYYSLIVSIIF